MDIVVNIAELKAEVARNTFGTQELSMLSENTVFVAGSYFDDNDFCVVLTSKSLLSKFILQRNHALSFLAVDGTYKLNDVKFPTLVLGTVDLNRKFILSN